MLGRHSHMAAVFAAGALLLSPPPGLMPVAFGLMTLPAQAQSAGTSPSTARQVAAGAPREAPAQYQTLYVNPESGNDSAEGLQNQPFRTVTHALTIALPNTVIVLAPGRYTESSGEVFPLQLKPGVTIQGAPGSRDRTAIIEGGGDFVSPLRSQQNAAILAADRAGIAQVAISNPNGYGVWIESASPTIIETAFVGNRQTGIYVAGGSPRVQSSYFSGNQVAGLIISGASSASIQSNIFDGTGDAIRVMDEATPEITGNRMTNNDAALVLVGNARPVLQGNQIAGNRRNEVVQVAARTRDVSDSEQLVSGSAEKPPESAAPVQPNAVTQLNTQPDDLPVIQAAAQPIEPTVAQPVTQLAAQPGEPSAEPAARSISSLRARLTASSVDPPTAQLAIAQPDSQLLTSPAQTLPTTSPTLEADAVSGEPLAGAPGSALAALRPGSAAPPSALTRRNADSPVLGSPDQSAAPVELEPAAGPDLSALRSRLALAPRAVSGENDNSPVLDSSDRDASPANESGPEARPTPINLPVIPVNNNRLAVPNSYIPVGSGESRTVFSPPSGGSSGLSVSNSRAQALGLHYKVFVETSDPFVQDDVRGVVPDAFRTYFEGQMVMQVGAFPTEAEAEDRRQLLEDYNFDVRVESLR